MNFPPRRIRIESDDNEIEFVRVVLDPKKKTKSYLYRFTKSKYSLNKEVIFSENELRKQLTNFFIPIL